MDIVKLILLFIIGTIAGFAFCDFDRQIIINQQEEFCCELCTKIYNEPAPLAGCILECKKKAREK